ncbi:hypothetical protein E9232_001320 [Inquilinus ginsengisoli]|uniref:5-hmdU DNA kinase helical domain-containing protein n=1 Tax=Inquilinus ginsengisoli TaxID=363840 RepID=A0ABU1JJN5_9PROT|nr:nucleotide kinase domain-containing protein [Inquilinus ginsengisoli]MDR6288813.1 hypothetical protein [Inquilinus ginsengisoli]
MITPLAPTEVFDSYWRFAAERLAIYYRRLVDPVGPWTDNPILRDYRFTNAFRAADRVSQYLIREVQYREDRSQAPAEIFFRTILFKLFNRIDTWALLEKELGPLSWQNARFEAISNVLDNVIGAGQRVYSAAYIMPSPAFGHQRKHSNHLAMLSSMMRDGLPARLAGARSFDAAYGMILNYPGLGPFLAFQYAIDLNYSNLLNFSESEFVVAGPGALDGIAKCFTNARSLDPAHVIYEIAERQDDEFRRLGLQFGGLFGRRLQPIDCQNLFCEISKYARVAHPDVSGLSGRTRIKQRYSATNATVPASPYFPPKWNLKVLPMKVRPVVRSEPAQLSLL